MHEMNINFRSYLMVCMNGGIEIQHCLMQMWLKYTLMITL